MQNNSEETGHAEKKRWYVAFSKPRQEETARFHLETKAVEVFYPKLFLPVANRRGKQVLPLFPNYLFVHIDIDSPAYTQVLWCRGIKRFVSFGGGPADVEESVIKFMREQADPSGLIVARSNLRIGDEVQISKGPFKGLVGIIQEPPDHKSRIRVLMSILNREVRVRVPADYINVGWVAPLATCVGQ